MQEELNELTANVRILGERVEIYPLRIAGRGPFRGLNLRAKPSDRI